MLHCVIVTCDVEMSILCPHERRGKWHHYLYINAQLKQWSFFFFFSFYKLKLMNVGQLLNWFGELGLKKRPGSVVTVVEGMNIGTLLLIKEN